MARAIIGRGHTLNYFYNFHIPAEFLLLFFFFRQQVASRKRVIIFNLMALFGVTVGAVLLFQYGIGEKFLSEWVCANNLVFTSWMLIMLLDIFEDDKKELNFYQPQMWQLLGLFFYTSCTLVIFSLWHYIMKNRDTVLNNLWIIHDIFNTLMYIIFTISFILERRNAAKGRPWQELNNFYVKN